MIHFTDGTSITNQEAADLIRKEPYGLISRTLIDKDGHRCAGGVLLGSEWDNAWPRQTHGQSEDLWIDMVQANNSFTGKPAQRREFMARGCESRKDEDK